MESGGDDEVESARKAVLLMGAAEPPSWLRERRAIFIELVFQMLLIGVLGFSLQSRRRLQRCLLVFNMLFLFPVTRARIL